MFVVSCLNCSQCIWIYYRIHIITSGQSSIPIFKSEVMRVKFTLVFIVVFFSSYAQSTTNTFSSPGNGTFKVPAGVTSLNVECWGAGGAGGGATAILSIFGGGGGGGGAYSRVILSPVTPSSSINYTIGFGGVGLKGENGGDGGSTLFSTVTAQGGKGGRNGNSSNGTGGAGGTAAGLGVIFSGGMGGTPGLVGGLLSSGGGGGSAGNAQNGNNGNLGTGGAAVAGGSSGSSGITLSGTGIDNTSFSGGGGGAKGLLLSDFKGGNGGNGQIKVTYTCPAYGFSNITATGVCTSAGSSSLIVLTGTASSLPLGDYKVTYNRSNPASSDIIVNASVGVAGTLSFTAIGLTSAGTSTITVTNLSSESCSTTISTSNSVAVTVSPPSAGGAIAAVGPVCAGSTSGVLALSGHTGNVVGWESSVSPFVSWNPIVNTSTIYTSGALSETTSFRAVVKSGICEAIVSTPTTVVVNPAPGIVTVGVLNSICYNTNAQTTTLPYTTITNSPTSYSILWNAAANAAGLTNQGATAFAFSSGGGTINNITIPAGVAANTYFGTMTIFNANCSVSQPIQLTIIPKPEAPLIGVKTQPTCAQQTGTITLNGLPAAVTWTISQTGAAVNSYTGTGVGYTVTNLIPGNYSFSVAYAGSCASAAVTANLNNLITNTYNGSWSNGTPTLDHNLIFDSNYVSSESITGNISGCSCLINAGKSVLIEDGDTLTIYNLVINNGTLTFENNASLVQINNDAENIGDVIYKRTSSPMKNFDYTYWSSPVLGQTLFNVSPNTLSDKYFSYAINSWQQENSSTVMTPGKGYIIRTPKGGLWGNGENVIFPYSQKVQFIGVPNNGSISGESVSTGNFYLVGNPYPSALDADRFLFEDSNNSDILDGTIYFWTHYTPITQNSYNRSDYASYNGVGGVATLPAYLGGEVPSGRIAVGQSFFALAKADGVIKFNNEMRITGNNSQFFKGAATQKSNVLERHRVWLNMSNKEGAFKQLLIGYIEGATNGFDSDFDGVSLDGNPYLDFYSMNSDSKLVIQGRVLPFSSADEVTLGYRSAIEGEFTISIDAADGVLADHDIFLLDKMTNIVHNLKTSDYLFTTTTGVFQDRFVLMYANSNLGTDSDVDNKTDVLVWKQNEEVIINSDSENIDKVYMYDLSGKKLFAAREISQKNFRFSNPSIAKQIVLFRIILENGFTTIKRVIF